jgi:hypothetical protein
MRAWHYVPSSVIVLVAESRDDDLLTLQSCAAAEVWGPGGLEALRVEMKVEWGGCNVLVVICTSVILKGEAHFATIPKSSRPSRVGGNSEIQPSYTCHIQGSCFTKGSDKADRKPKISTILPNLCLNTQLGSKPSHNGHLTYGIHPRAKSSIA